MNDNDDNPPIPCTLSDIPTINNIIIMINWMSIKSLVDMRSSSRHWQENDNLDFLTQRTRCITCYSISRKKNTCWIIHQPTLWFALTMMVVLQVNSPCWIWVLGSNASTCHVHKSSKGFCIDYCYTPLCLLDIATLDKHILSSII